MLKILNPKVLNLKDLISKKQLLDLTGISYGQLYRWKRKKLILEEWFIKKSSFTGQETYFPKKKVLDRIDKIVNMKDGLSLDEIADMFTPNVTYISLKEDELKSKGIVSDITFNICRSLYGEEKIFNFKEILFMYILEQFIKLEEISLEDGRNIIKALDDNYSNLKDKNYDVVLLRKYEESICILVSVQNEIYVENSSKLVKKVNILRCIEELKLKLLV